MFGIFARKLWFYLLLAFWLVACPARFERATYGLEGRCSIHLSYGQLGNYKRLFVLSHYQQMATNN